MGRAETVAQTSACDAGATRADRCTQCKTTTMPEVIKYQSPYKDHEMIVAEFRTKSRHVRHAAARKWYRLMDKNV